MKKLIIEKIIIKTTFLSGLFILFALLQACSSAVVRDKVIRHNAVPKNINGGFENVDSDNTPDGWYANNLPQTKKYAEFSVDNSVSHSGSRSIRISI